MNTTFSFKRFKRQFLLDLNTELSRLLILIAAYIGLSLFVFLYIVVLTEKPKIITNEFDTLFYFSFLTSCYLFSGSLFSDLRNKSMAASYLMIPASLLEKYLSNVSLAIVHNVLSLISYSLIMPVLIYLLEMYNDQIFFVHSISPSKVTIMLGVFLITQPILLFGAISFQKSPITKIVICIGVSIALIILLHSLYSSNKEWLSLGLRRFCEYHILNILIIGLLLSAPIFLLLTFLRLKEKEV